MDTRQLKTLLAIVEHGTFARAAKHVHLTPSAVSQQIQALEAEVGRSLFDRSSRPPRLTVQGQQMVDAARRLVQVAEEALDAISGRVASAPLVLGSVRTSALGLMPRAIVLMEQAHPGLRMKLRVAMSEALLVDVAAGRLDAAMVAENPGIPDTLRWRPFIREPLFVIAPPGAPPLSATGYLTRYPLVRFRSNVPLAHMIDRELARMNLTLNEIAEIDTVSAIVACVANGLGVSVVPNVAIKESMAPLMTAPFGDPHLHRQIGLVDRPGSPRASLIADLHACLVQVSEEHGTGEGRPVRP